MLDEPNQILARLGWNEQVKRNWANPNGSQIRQGSAVNTEQKDCILNLSLHGHYFEVWNDVWALVLMDSCGKDFQQHSSLW